MIYPAVLVGVVIALIGGLGIAGIVPLSVVNTVNISTPNVSCSSSGSCSVTFTISNNNATSNFAVYMKVQDAQFNTKWQNTIQVQQAASTVNIPQLTLGTFLPGAYIFSAFAVSNLAVVISQTTSTPFNVGGNYQLTIDPYNTASGTITVSNSVICSVNPATQSTCSYPVGSAVSIKYSPQSNYAISQWCYFASAPISRQGCFPSSAPTLTYTNGVPQPSNAPNPLRLMMNASYEVFLVVGAPNVQYFTVIPTISTTGGCPNGNNVPCLPKGTVSPSSATNIYQSSSFGATSATFTAIPSANFTFANFQVNGKNFTSNPLTLQYSDLQPIQISGQVQFQLYTYFKAKLFYPLGVGAYAGIITNPAAKNSNYYYLAGASVTVALANIASNVCFTGWLVDGNSAGTGNSVTVTMNQMHNVFAQGIGKPAGGCGTPPPTGNYSPVAIGLLLGGIGIAGAGSVLGKKEHE